MYILDVKKRWRLSNNDMMFQDIGVCEKIFVACCCIHNFLLEVMELNDACIGRGAPLGDDCIWLDGHTTPLKEREGDQVDVMMFGRCRSCLSMHIRVYWDKGPIEISQRERGR